MSETRPLLGSTKGKDNVSGFFWVSIVVRLYSLSALRSLASSATVPPALHLPRAAERGAERGALHLHR